LEGELKELHELVKDKDSQIRDLDKRQVSEKKLLQMVKLTRQVLTTVPAAAASTSTSSSLPTPKAPVTGPTAKPARVVSVPTISGTIIAQASASLSSAPASRVPLAPLATPNTNSANIKSQALPLSSTSNHPVKPAVPIVPTDISVPALAVSTGPGTGSGLSTIMESDQ
jgi:hypothetical protein